MLEAFRGKVTHGRVAIGPSYRDGDMHGRVAKPQAHVGHASTLLIADHVCRRLGIPLWLRVNVAPARIRQRVSPDLAATQGNFLLTVNVLCEAMFDFAAMVSFLEVPIWRWYQPLEPIVRLNPEGYAALARFAEEADEGAQGKDPRWQWFDDAAVHWPALIIRGGDWCPPAWTAGTEEFVRLETRLFELMGRDRYEINTPLITVDGTKMGSGDLNSVSWRILMPLGREAAREFLLDGIDLDNLSGGATEWSWDAWSRAVRSAWGPPRVGGLRGDPDPGACTRDALAATVRRAVGGGLRPEQHGP